MRLDKFLSQMGIGSRKEVKEFIKKGQIKVNGEAVKKADTKVNPDLDEVSYLGSIIQYLDKVYIVMNKPSGVISATYDNMHQTVIDLIDEPYNVLDLHPVGRLDIDTEGLLLITNDGQFTHRIMSPKKKVTKTYYAEIDGRVDESAIDLFSAGVDIGDDTLCKPADLMIEESGDTSTIFVTLTEGRFHQVKRMFQAIDTEVTFLRRVAIGELLLPDDLELGEYRELTKEEIEQIFQ